MCNVLCFNMHGGQIASANTDTIISCPLSVDNNNTLASSGDQNQSFS
jgi:hypothetical protein